MLLRSISIGLVGCALLAAPLNSVARTKRGPSTAEERQRVLQLIQDWEADPIGPNAKNQFSSILVWLSKVPDVEVNLCTIFEREFWDGRQDGSAIYIGLDMEQTKYVLEHYGQHYELIGEYQAGVEGALRVYEMLVKANPGDRQPYYDDLVQRRDAGRLAPWIKNWTVPCSLIASCGTLQAGNVDL